MPNSKPRDRLDRGPAATLVAGLVALAVGAFGLFSFLDGRDEEPEAADTAVLVITQDLPVGTDGGDIVTEGLVEVTTLDAATVPVDALTSPSQLAGRALAVPKNRGDTVTALDLAVVSPANVVEIPPGLEAVAVTLAFDPGVAGYVKAGDSVTVYSILDAEREAGVTTVQDQATTGAFAAESTGPVVQTLLRDVIILDVSADVAPRYGTQTEARLAPGQITYLLAVEPADAARIIYATTNERIYLALVDDEAPPDDRVRVDANDLRADLRTPTQLAADDEAVAPTIEQPTLADTDPPAAATPDSGTEGEEES